MGDEEISFGGEDFDEEYLEEYDPQFDHDDDVSNGGSYLSARQVDYEAGEIDDLDGDMFNEFDNYD